MATKTTTTASKYGHWGVWGANRKVCRSFVAQAKIRGLVVADALEEAMTDWIAQARIKEARGEE